MGDLSWPELVSGIAAASVLALIGYGALVRLMVWPSGPLDEPADEGVYRIRGHGTPDGAGMSALEPTGQWGRELWLCAWMVAALQLEVEE